MGLINEVANVSNTLNRKEQERREKLAKKQRIFEYNQEIKSNLQTLFYNLFDNYNIETAYKKAVTEKTQNIDKLTEYIEKITYKKDGKEFYKYLNNFDIVDDLNENYYKILDKIYKEYLRQEKAKNSDLLENLQNKFCSILSKCECKTKGLELMQQKIYIDKIIKEITTDKQKQAFLYDNYFKILRKAKQYYNGYLLEEKREIQAIKEQAKIKRRDNLISLLLFGKFLDGINKRL